MSTTVCPRGAHSRRQTYDFSRLKTFGFANASLGYPQGMSADLNREEQMKKALGEQLIAHGYKRGVDGRPDFLITCRAGTRGVFLAARP